MAERPFYPRQRIWPSYGCEMGFEQHFQSTAGLYQGHKGDLFPRRLLLKAAVSSGGHFHLLLHLFRRFNLHAVTEQTWVEERRMVILQVAQPKDQRKEFRPLKDLNQILTSRKTQV
ncbi:hypothetical protein LINGRAPRIM_LOCUS133 [Linum grandiflorum]